ncbi:nitroreductase [Rhodococcus sp. X156]|uniref:Acg family FMN-binding oxidoreductase n=1 Tax=Rhodococcus sp. X156 TaxID=2499145 RepID=UPI000FD9A7F1|nr:nitroreductase [Rhodococcus sp. X156]
MVDADQLDLATAREALAVASRAPSVLNTQPWSWRVQGRTVDLYADPGRQLTVVDPHGRDMTISCGAALDHARVAFLAMGWRSEITRLPRPGEPLHLATMQLHRATEPDRDAIALVAAAEARHTDRRPFRSVVVPETTLADVAQVPRDPRVQVTLITDPTRRDELVVGLGHADAVQRNDPRYRDELASWTHTSVASGEGIPAGNLPSTGTVPGAVPGRAGQPGDLASPPAQDDGAVFCVLSTPTDQQVDWLCSGETLSAVLLQATLDGFATCTLSQVSESPVVRNLARLVALDGEGEPQVMVRVGEPVTEEFPGPRTPRRPLTDTVTTQG